MNKLIISGIGIIALFSVKCNSPEIGNQDYVFGDVDSIPDILPENHNDLIYGEIRHQAAMKFATHQLPATLDEWEAYRMLLKDEVIKKTGFKIDHQLPLNMKESGTTEMK